MQGLDSHREKRLKNMKYQCDICHRFVIDMQKHLRNHESQVYECHICGVSLTRKDNLKRHIRIQHSLTDNSAAQFFFTS